jgi:ABC-type nickel/cobalt efflux system permease component RcnA
VGALLLLASIRGWRQGTVREQERMEKAKQAKPWFMALATGMTPCPGAVLMMLFCLSLGMAWLGVVLALVMSLGMALTISAVCLAAGLGKNLTLGMMPKNPRVLFVAHQSLQTMAALGVMLLGALFLAAVLRP